MISKKKLRVALHACGIALAALGCAAHAEPDVPPPPARTTEASVAEANVATAPVSMAPAAPQTRVLFKRGVYKPGIEKLRVVRREDTAGRVAGQVALNVAFALLAGGAGAQSFSKDDLGGTTLAALEDDPLGVNPAISDLTDTLSQVATDIYRKRAEAAHALALTDGSTPEEIADAAKVQAQADTPLLPGPWHLVYENLLGSDELFRLKFGAQLGRAGFMRPPAECFYQSEPIAWAQWQADNWQRLREERAKAVAACTGTLAATPEKFW